MQHRIHRRQQRLSCEHQSLPDDYTNFSGLFAAVFPTSGVYGVKNAHGPSPQPTA